MPSDPWPSNPYAASSLPATGDVSAELLSVNNRTNTGGLLWSPCWHRVYSDRIELKFLTQSYTLPIKHIKMLRSGGKRYNRYLEIVHDDPVAPETLRVLPLHPARWYETFESLDIPTEDEADLRQSKQLYYRTDEWFSNAEGLFWLMVILAGPAIGVLLWCWDALNSILRP